MVVVKVQSWGRLDAAEHRLQPLSDASRVAAQVQRDGAGLAFGMGRSYGDVCLNPGGVLWQTTGLDRFLAFDETQGRLRVEAGVLLRDLQRLLLPRGWQLPVVPGTQLVTVGGAIANDVHGKNHHVAGSFGDHVVSLQLARTDGSTQTVMPGDALFAATVGGLGLTGVIVEAELQLQRATTAWLTVESHPYHDLEGFFALADSSEAQWEHTVSWVDCVATPGRGIFLRARPATSALPAPTPARALRVPFTPPFSLVNRLSLKPFNRLYYQLKQSQQLSVQHRERFFHPLDDVLEWNRLYGPRGFYQYQCVLPRARGREGIQAMLAAIARANEGSFLAVLKTFGERASVGMLSFAQPGVTLALDFPNRGARTLHLFAALDAIVAEAGGRLYPAKDARMPRALFEAGYPRLAEFLPHRDPGIRSALSQRLMGH